MSKDSKMDAITQAVNWTQSEEGQKEHRESSNWAREKSKETTKRDREKEKKLLGLHEPLAQ